MKLLKSSRLFLFMFLAVCLLNVCYSILKSARTALAVADLGGGAGSIPWYELLGTMPGAVLLTFILSFLLNRFSIRKVFFCTLVFFTLFFVFFSSILYPLIPKLEMWGFSYLPSFLSMSFFVMAELWKIALLTILFWGLVNQYLPVLEAKKFYAPLMLGGSLGTILAGPLISFCTSEVISGGEWGASLNFLMFFLALLGALVFFLFQGIYRILIQNYPQREVEKKEKLSFLTSIQACFQSRYLLLLAWVTIADYIAYALGEIIFLDVLKTKFPDPRDYCDFMGKLSLWNGILTAFSALVITPYLLSRCRWVVASLVTPLCLLLTEGAFFFALWEPSMSKNIELLVLLGSFFYCFVRAAKYTLFDTSKEISFVLLPPLEKMQGKLVVDGMCARLGRGGGSFLSLSLVQIFGSVMGASPIAGVLAMIIAFSCLLATTRLGALVDKRSKVEAV